MTHASLSTTTGRTIQLLAFRTQSIAHLPVSLPHPLIGIRGGSAVVDFAGMIEGSYDWCVNLGAPSALVAGAVVATLYENMHRGDLEVLPGQDSRLMRLGKQMTRLLLLSAFALEAVSIFVTTVTGTMLLSRTAEQMTLLHHDDIQTPLEFLRKNFEFEYLTARISFLQGLLNWLAAIGLEHCLPSPGDSLHTISMNRFIACSMMTLIVLMLSFYNHHMTFYHNYLHMLGCWLSVLLSRFHGNWPPSPLSLLLWPITAASIYFGYEALFKGDQEGSENTK